MNGLAFGQAMSELWEEDETLRRALPWKALTLQAPQKEMRCLQQDVRLREAHRTQNMCININIYTVYI